jgi:hypothetical protein
MENAGVDREGDVVDEKTNPGSTDITGMKQAPNRKTDDARKLASATPTRRQGHGSRAHRPSVRDPMQVFKRIARGHISAEGTKRSLMSENIEVEELENMENELAEIIRESRKLKK